MEIPHTKALDTIRQLFDSQDLSVLSTRKYDNLVANPRVAMLINNSQNRAEDITNAISVTATGEAFPVIGQKKEQLLALYLTRHPHMKTFTRPPTTAVIRMAVAKYIMVSLFQNVVKIKVGS